MKPSNHLNSFLSHQLQEIDMKIFEVDCEIIHLQGKLRAKEEKKARLVIKKEEVLELMGDIND